MRYHTASEQNYALLATKERWNIPLSPPIIADYNASLRWEWNIWVRDAMILNSALETVIYTLPMLFHMFLQKPSLQKACFEFLAKNDNCLNFLQFACWKSAFAHFRNKCTFSTNWGAPQSQCSLQNTTYIQTFWYDLHDTKKILRIYQKFRIYSYIVRLLSESYKLNAVKIRIEIWINWNWILSPGPGAGSRRRGPVPGSLAQHPSDNSTQSYTCFGQSKTTWTKSGIELGARSSQTFPCFPITVHGVQLLKINIRVSKPLARCLWPSVTNGQWFRAENGKLRSLRGKSGILGRCYLWMRSNVSWRHRKKTVDTVEPVNVVCISGDFTYFHWNNKGQSQRKSLEPLK